MISLCRFNSVPVVPRYGNRLEKTSFNSGAATICAGSGRFPGSRLNGSLFRVTPHLRSLTVYPPRCTNPLCKPGETSPSFRYPPRRTGHENSLINSVPYSDREARSTTIPGPMVVDRAIFFRNTPLEDAGLSLLMSPNRAIRLPFSASTSKLALPMVV